jgi:hypothetical protein
MMEAVALIPRTISEIHRMQEVLGVLDREMSDLSTQLSEFDQRNISGVEDLSRLDTLKLNMEMCRDTLEEHARWNQLVREAKTMMESGGHFSDSADRFENLPNSPNFLAMITLFADSRLSRTLWRSYTTCPVMRRDWRLANSSLSVSCP